MPLTDTISQVRENAAIDMMVSMVAEDLAEQLHIPVEEALSCFLQSKTCELLYDRKSKLWWDGPAAIAEQYLIELRR